MATALQALAKEDASFESVQRIIKIVDLFHKLPSWMVLLVVQETLFEVINMVVGTMTDLDKGLTIHRADDPRLASIAQTREFDFHFLFRNRVLLSFINIVPFPQKVPTKRLRVAQTLDATKKKLFLSSTTTRDVSV